MPRRSPSSPSVSTDSHVDRLQAAVDTLADSIRFITDVLEQIREDLNWLTRNGIPHQPLHVLVHRMPLVPNRESRDGSFEFSFVSPPVRDPTAETLADEHLRAAVIDTIVDRLTEPLGQLAQEQLNVILGVLDDSHRTVLQAIRDPHSVQSAESDTPRPRQTTASVAASTATTSSDDLPPPGQLF